MKHIINVICQIFAYQPYFFSGYHCCWCCCRFCRWSHFGKIEKQFLIWQKRKVLRLSQTFDRLMVFLLSSLVDLHLNLNNNNNNLNNLNINNTKLLLNNRLEMLVKLMPRLSPTVLKPTITISLLVNGILKTSRPVNKWLPTIK